MRQLNKVLEQFLIAVPTAGAINSVRRLGGGGIQDNWLIVCGDGARYVVRLNAQTVLSLSHDKATEFFLIRALHEAGVRPLPAPVAYLDIEGGAAVYGFVGGESRGGGTVRTALAQPQWGESLVAQLGEFLSGLHAIEPTGLPRAVRDKLLVFSGTHASDAMLARLASNAALADELAMGEGFRELIAAVREQIVAFRESESSATAYRGALCHGDFRNGNFLADPSVSHAPLQAVLDWEFAVISDPYEDLGWFLSPSWRFGQLTLSAGGLSDASPFLRAYFGIENGSLRQGGVDFRRLWIWQMLAVLRWAVIAAMQYQRLLAGEDSLDLALTGYRLPELALELNVLLAWQGRAEEEVF